MAIKDKAFTASRDDMVRWMQYIGQFILDNAEDIVGNYHGVSGYDIIGHVDMHSLPTVEVKRSHCVADWGNRRRGYGERIDCEI